jgi:hypothetical protein
VLDERFDIGRHNISGDLASLGSESVGPQMELLPKVVNQVQE